MFVQQGDDEATRQMCSAQSSPLISQIPTTQPLASIYVGEYSGVSITEEERRMVFKMFFDQKSAQINQEISQKNADLSHQLFQETTSQLSFCLSKLEELKQCDDRDKLFFSDAFRQLVANKFKPSPPTLKLTSGSAYFSVPLGESQSSPYSSTQESPQPCPSEEFSQTPIPGPSSTVNCQELILEILGRYISFGKGTDGAKAQLQYGRRASKEYKRLYGREPPKRNQFVNGSVIPVNNYGEEDRSWLRKIAEDVLKDLGLMIN